MKRNKSISYLNNTDNKALFIIYDVFNHSKLYWVCVGIVILLSFGFTLTHFSVGIDDELFNYYFYENALLRQGRWNYLFYKFILFDTYKFLPFWRDFIGVIFILIGCNIFTYLFRKITNEFLDDSFAIVFTCIFISFPYVGYLFIFMVSTIEMGVKLVLCSLAMLLFFNMLIENKVKIWSVLGNLFILTLIGTTIAQSVFIVFFALCFLFLVYQNNKIKDLKRPNLILMLSSFGFFSMASLAVLFDNFIGKMLMNIMNVRPDNYIQNHVRYSLKLGIVNGVLIPLKNIFISIFKFSTTDYIKGIMFICVVTIIAFGLFFTLKRRNILILLSTIGIALSPYLIIFVTGNQNISKRVTYCFGLFISFVIAYVFRILINIKTHKMPVKYICIYFVFLLIIHQTKQLNIIFFDDYMRYQRDLTIMNNVAYEIKRVNADCQRALFVGYVEEKKGGYQEDDVVGFSIFNWDRRYSLGLELDAQRIYSFLSFHGINIGRPNEYDIKRIRGVLENMPRYPQEGYVVDMGDYVIVNFGNSTLLKYNYRINNNVNLKNYNLYDKIDFKTNLITNNINIKMVDSGMYLESIKGMVDPHVYNIIEEPIIDTSYIMFDIETECDTKIQIFLRDELSFDEKHSIWVDLKTGSNIFYIQDLTESGKLTDIRIDLTDDMDILIKKILILQNREQ